MTEPWTAASSPQRGERDDQREPIIARRGLTSGMIAASALLGLLLGMGRRAGTAFRPLNATAHVLLGTRADDVWGFNGVVTIVGVLVVLALSAVTGVVVAWLSSFRTLRALVAAAGVALVGYLLHVNVVARSPGGLSALLSNGELRALYVTLAAALVLGMRLAFSSGTSANRR